MKSIQGSTKQCLAHLAKTLKGDPDYFGKRRMVASFVHVDEQTVYRYFKRVPQLIGEPLLRMQHYLEFLGYDVRELQRINPILRDAGRLIAFDLMTLAEMADFVGFQGKGNSRVSVLLAVFRGARGTSEEKLALFASLVQRYASKLAAKQTAAERPAHFENANTPENNGGLASCKDALITAFVRQVEALVPLAEQTLSDEFSVEDRERIRQQANGGVSRLSLLLTRMTGEAARNALAGSQNEGGPR